MKPMKSGDCYRNVYLYVRAHGGMDSPAKIVHGSILSIRPGRRKRILHAWIEDDGDVIDPTQGVTINKKDYYRLVGAKPSAKYTFEQMAVLAIRSGHWGPWE